MGEKPGVNIIEERFSFDKTSDQEDYRAVNQEFIERTLPIRDGLVIVDLMCGPGLFTELARKLLKGYSAEIIGIDLNGASIKKAQARLEDEDERISIRFVHDHAQNVLDYVPPGTADIVYMGNSLHEVSGDDQKRIIVACAAEALTEDGFVGWNSTFTSEASKNRAFALWKAGTIEAIGAEQRDKRLKSFQDLPTEYYLEIFTEVGLKTGEPHSQEWPLSKLTMSYFAEYDKFINGMFADIILPRGLQKLSPTALMQVKSDALKTGLEIADKRHRERQRRLGKPESELVLPRLWVDDVAVKVAA